MNQDGGMKAEAARPAYDGEIPNELARLEKEIAYLSECLETLRVNLSPIVSPPNEAESSHISVDRETRMSQYGEQLASNIDRIKTLSRQTIQLIECLEV